MNDLRPHEVRPFSVDSHRSVRQQRFLIRLPLAAVTRAAAGLVGEAALALLLGVGAGLPLAADAQTFCGNPADGYKGFGRNTTGGVGQQVIHVTNLDDYIPGIQQPIPGSLRWAVEEGTPAGNRCIVFDVGGTIEALPSVRPSPCVNDDGYIPGFIRVKGPNVTIDGFTAPSPGITLKNWGLALHYLRGVENVVVRGIRVRDTVPGLPLECAGADGFQIVGVNKFVLDHVSVAEWADGSLDVAGDSNPPNFVPSQNGTIQWSIFGGRQPPNQDKSLLVKYGARRISLHHNLFVNALDRNPYIAWSDNLGLTPTEIVADVRNNLVWGYGWTGTSVRHNGWANAVSNYYHSAALASNPDPADAALYVREGGVAHASGDAATTESGTSGTSIDSKGPAERFPADPVRTTGAVAAAHQIVSQAGARSPNFGLDAADQAYINQISLSPAPATYEESGATYTGAWSTWGPESGDFSGGTMKSSNLAASTATFSFSGTKAIWLSIRCEICGIAEVSVDGAAPVSVNTAGPALPPNSLASEPMYSSPDLPPGNHTMVITVTGNTTSAGTHVVVDGFEVMP
jgi:pectate lyase